MDEREYRMRTKRLALEVIRLVEELPRTMSAQVIGKQIVRSGTSIGANYRSACRGKSAADMVAKLSIVEEEADETMYWMELLMESGLSTSDRIAPIMKECNEIVAMTVSSIKTLRSRTIQNPKSKI